MEQDSEEQYEAEEFQPESEMMEEAPEEQAVEEPVSEEPAQPAAQPVQPAVKDNFWTFVTISVIIIIVLGAVLYWLMR